jgi:hypothetical protein
MGGFSGKKAIEQTATLALSAAITEKTVEKQTVGDRPRAT